MQKIRKDGTLNLIQIFNKNISIELTLGYTVC